MVKRVLYAIGAGGAVPALGLMPAVHAAATVQHTPQKGGKSVSLRHVESPHVARACSGPVSKNKKAGSLGEDGFSVTLEYLKHCAIFASGATFFQGSSSPIRSMRTRAYSAHGTRIFSDYITSADSSGRVYYHQGIFRSVAKVCEAIVLQKDVRKVINGPLCEKI